MYSLYYLIISMIDALLIIDFQEKIILLENPGQIEDNEIDGIKEKLLRTCK